MVKLKSGTKGLVRLFYLDEHRTCIRWRPSRKSEKAKSKLNVPFNGGGEGGMAAGRGGSSVLECELEGSVKYLLYL